MKLSNYERRIAKLQKDEPREFVCVDCIEGSMKNLNTGKIINESELKELEKTSDVLKMFSSPPNRTKHFEKDAFILD